jgi:ParB family transcriptional regulator, chromosome partitioning protein
MTKTIEYKQLSFFQFLSNVRDCLPPEDKLRALGESYVKNPHFPVLAQVTGRVIDGECRLRGVALVKPEFLVPTIITDTLLSKEEIVQAQLVTAIHRNELTPQAITKGIAGMLEANPKLTRKEVSERLNFTDASCVTKYMAVYDCIEPVQENYFAGKLSVGAVYGISKLPADQQSEILGMALAGATRDQIEAHGRQRRNGNAEATTIKVSKLVCPLPCGVTVQFKGDGVSLESAIDAMAELTKELRVAIGQKLNASTVQKVLKDKSRSNGKLAG